MFFKPGLKLKIKLNFWELQILIVTYIFFYQLSCLSQKNTFYVTNAYMRLIAWISKYVFRFCICTVDRKRHWGGYFMTSLFSILGIWITKMCLRIVYEVTRLA